jgi:hypothetical protein
MAKITKTNNIIFRRKAKKKLGRHTKRINKHKSWKASVGQG